MNNAVLDCVTPLVCRSLFPLSVASMLFAPQAFADGPAVGQLGNVIGTAEIVRDGQKLPATKGMPVFSSDTLITADKAAVKIQFHDGGSFMAFEGSTVKIEEYRVKAGGKGEISVKSAFEIAKGKVRFFVKPQEKGTTNATYKTANAVMGIRGTSGHIDASNPSSTKLVVLTGKVEVFNPTNPNQKVYVKPGEFTEVMKGKAPTLPQVAPPAMLKSLGADANKLDNGPNKEGGNKGTPAEEGKEKGNDKGTEKGPEKGGEQGNPTGQNEKSGASSGATGNSNEASANGSPVGSNESSAKASSANGTEGSANASPAASSDTQAPASGATTSKENTGASSDASATTESGKSTSGSTTPAGSSNTTNDSANQSAKGSPAPASATSGDAAKPSSSAGATLAEPGVGNGGTPATSAPSPSVSSAGATAPQAPSSEAVRPPLAQPDGDRGPLIQRKAVFSPDGTSSVILSGKTPSVVLPPIAPAPVIVAPVSPQVQTSNFTKITTEQVKNITTSTTKLIQNNIPAPTDTVKPPAPAASNPAPDKKKITIKIQLPSTP